jgi:hypothetical protein
VVLVVEGTRGINFLFGVIIAVVVANWVGSLLGQDGVYESEIERDGNVFFLRHEAPHRLATLTAEQVFHCIHALLSHAQKSNRLIYHVRCNLLILFIFLTLRIRTCFAMAALTVSRELLARRRTLMVQLANNSDFLPSVLDS